MVTTRWDTRTSERVLNKEINTFLDEIIVVCKKHNMSISHEDCHGGFEIENFSDNKEQWLRDASIAPNYKDKTTDHNTDYI